MKTSVITICAVIGSVTFIGTVLGSLVDVSLEPSAKTVHVGDPFTLELWLRSDPQGQATDGADVILQWDPEYVRLDGKTEDGPYDWMMTFFSDIGDSDRQTMLTLFAQLGEDSPVTALHAITLNFTALAVAESTLVSIPASVPGAPPTCVSWQGEDITGTLSGADIAIVPEPASLALLGLGVTAAAALLRRRRQ
jgi:hypothetical protein